MKKRSFLISSLVAAGFLPQKAMALAVPHPSDDNQGKTSLFDVFKGQHRYILAGHQSHSSHVSHGSHTSHVSSSGGGYVLPSAPRYPSTTTPVTPAPSLTYPSPAPATPKVLPGNAEKFKNILYQVQSALSVYGYYTGPVDGQMGPMTREAIKKMQNDYGLKVTGTVTPEVLDALHIIAQ
jgi:His-Xaa-Ser repeat protein HxsA